MEILIQILQCFKSTANVQNFDVFFIIFVKWTYIWSVKNIQAIFSENSVYRYDTQELVLKENSIEGNLESELVVFYHVSEGEILAEDIKAFLMKLLSAAQKDYSNTLIINDKVGFKFKHLISNTTTKRVLVFGTTRKKLGLNLNVKRYKIYNIQGIECLFVDKLEVLKDDAKRKGALWSLMKTMFNLG